MIEAAGLSGMYSLPPSLLRACLEWETECLNKEKYSVTQNWWCTRPQEALRIAVTHRPVLTEISQLCLRLMRGEEERKTISYLSKPLSGPRLELIKDFLALLTAAGR
jgi:hypothetical protein